MSMLTKWDPFPPRWDPFREMEEMQNRLMSILGRAPVHREGGKEETLRLADWAPLVDIVEDEKEYLIKAELPEVRMSDIKVQVQDRMLSISGERVLQKEEKGKKYHRVERAYGGFERSFTLPEDADGGRISAEFKDGVLRVHVPKSPAARSKSIDIKVD